MKPLGILQSNIFIKFPKDGVRTPCCSLIDAARFLILVLPFLLPWMIFDLGLAADAQGHKLPRGESPGIAAKAAVKEAEAIERWGGWLRELDDNGYVVFRNLISGVYARSCLSVAM